MSVLSRRGRRSSYGRGSYGRSAAVVGSAFALVALAGTTDVLASVNVGSPGNDVTFGQDRDNAANTFIQPPGVTAKQHLDNTDVVFGRLGDDLVGGGKGDDVLIGGPGNDVLVGGPDSASGPGSDVALGDEGDDVAVWGTGDRSETYVGDVGHDTQIVGRLVTNGDSLKLLTYQGRKLPTVSLAGATQSCGLTPVPASQRVGEQFLLRIYASGQLSATIRLKDVERVVCTSARAGYARVADLTAPSPAFSDVPTSALGGIVEAMVSG